MRRVKVRGRVPASVLAAVVAGGVIVAAGIALLLVSIVHQRTTSDRTIKSNSYLTATTRVEELVVDAETGLRGYVITRNPLFLQPTKAAQDRIGSATAALEQAARVDGSYMPQVVSLNRSVRSYFSSYLPTVLGGMRRDPGSARSAATTLEGKRLVDAIRMQTAGLSQLVSARLDARERTAHDSANRAVRLAIAMLIVLTLLTIMLGAVLARLFQSRERARERAIFLAEAGPQLDRQVTAEDVLREFARLAEERGAELCLVVDAAVGDGTGGELSSPGAAGADPQLREVAASPEVGRAADRARDAAEESGVTEADPATVDSAGRPVHVLALACVAREVVVARAVMLRRDREWRDDEVAELDGLGARLALSLHARRLQDETAMLYRRSEHTVRTLQRSLLPRVLPEIPGCELAVRFSPGTEGDLVGGDFYDVFPLGLDRWAIVIGDVCGKGAEAAAVTSMVRWTLRSLAESARAPGETLRQLNEAMLRQEIGPRFITIALGFVTVGSREAEVRLACAGHPAPVVVTPDGTTETLAAQGDLLGVWPDVALQEETLVLPRCASVIFYTDGVTDQGPGPERSVAKALRNFRPGASAAALAGELERQAHHWNVASRDDMAILALRFQGGAVTGLDIPPAQRAWAARRARSGGSQVRPASGEVGFRQRPRPPWQAARRSRARRGARPERAATSTGTRPGTRWP
jgi:serine phosphatase RsbU (regulator of sigma subunit)/CHASE3 domain sensor protein